MRMEENKLNFVSNVCVYEAYEIIINSFVRKRARERRPSICLISCFEESFSFGIPTYWGSLLQTLSSLLSSRSEGETITNLSRMKFVSRDSNRADNFLEKKKNNENLFNVRSEHSQAMREIDNKVHLHWTPNLDTAEILKLDSRVFERRVVYHCHSWCSYETGKQIAYEDRYCTAEGIESCSSSLDAWTTTRHSEFVNPFDANIVHQRQFIYRLTQLSISSNFSMDFLPTALSLWSEAELTRILILNFAFGWKRLRHSEIDWNQSKCGVSVKGRKATLIRFDFEMTEIDFLRLILLWDSWEKQSATA